MSSKAKDERKDEVLSSDHGDKNIPLVELELQNVSYHPQIDGRKVQKIPVLNEISTKISPYKLTAWMGPSGSGKTSLISVAANLARAKDLSESSRVLVNGEPGLVPKRLVGIVWQDDLLFSSLTVEENLYYAARLKTPESVPDSQVRSTVEATMETLGLTHVRSVLAGNTKSRGISGGERKRVAVGAELVARPSLLLLDEPTSGLDATTAQLLVQTLKELSMSGHSVVMVIHQPRTAIYGLFDHLLLLSKGNAIYDGHPSKARGYLEAITSELPLETGLADWVMDIITEDEQESAKGGSRLAKNWRREESNKESFLLDDDSKPPREQQLGSLEELHFGPRFYTSRWTQLKLLTLRSMKQHRGERLTIAAVCLQLLYVIGTTMLYWRLPDTTARVFDRNSLLYFILIGQTNGIVIIAVNVFQQEQIILSRERAKKLYAVSSYYLAKTATDMTSNVLLLLIQASITYWVSGFRVSAAAFFKNIFAFYWSFSTAQSMGLFLSVFIPNRQMAMILAPPLTLFCVTLGGFLVPYESLRPGVAWVSYLSFARYGYSALMINEYRGREIPCATEVAISIGSSGQCPLPGEHILSDLGIQGRLESYWFNISMVIVLQVFFRVGAYILLRRSR